MPVTDIKLLRDQLAQVIGENKRQAAKPEDVEIKSREVALMLGQVVLERDLANQKLDEALAKVERLENALREVAEGKIKAERILEYYDNAHTPPSSHTITQREINGQRSEKRRTRPAARDAARAAATPRSAGRRPRRYGTGPASAANAGARTWRRSAPTTRSWWTSRTYPRWRSPATGRTPAGASTAAGSPCRRPAWSAAPPWGPTCSRWSLACRR